MIYSYFLFLLLTLCSLASADTTSVRSSTPPYTSTDSLPQPRIIGKPTQEMQDIAARLVDRNSPDALTLWKFAIEFQGDLILPHTYKGKGIQPCMLALVANDSLWDYITTPAGRFLKAPQIQDLNGDGTKDIIYEMSVQHPRYGVQADNPFVLIYNPAVKRYCLGSPAADTVPSESPNRPPKNWRLECHRVGR